MRTLLVILTLTAVLCAACAMEGPAGLAALSGERALEHVRAQVAFGPRPPGSEALEKCRAYIIGQLESWGYSVERDAFEAETPYGKKPMVNLIARTGPGANGLIALGSHYDSKYMEGKNFVGANDGGASTGLLLELTRVLAGSRPSTDYWFVFLDGEEAWLEWSAFDSTYGSRHLAQRWKREGVAARIRAFVLLDMIGDKNLDIQKELNSTPWLNEMVSQAAEKAGLQSILSPMEMHIEDDHLPFLRAGVPSVDIIDLNYGPNNTYHHTENDTLDKVSAQSLEKTGKLVLTLLDMLQKRAAR
jgi:Iap family predicted aminopeptidase